MILEFLLSVAMTCDPQLAGLFTPPRPTLGSYEVCTTAASIDESVSADVQAAPAEQLESLDAFGSAGAYDRTALAQLYGGRRVTVVRGWRVVGDRFESMTFLSPYPDPTLSRLESGTLIIRFEIPTEKR
ncbi:MAG TPA: hypothetical protein VH583_12940 [Vicinamibacterales bacterium]|jgi:hypothetical protein